ncbi:hypothetical protein H9Q69_013919 [Fusarium xylarioides]|uniref:Uncharacterized protein n=1 Tax=Fusarium xylarioides TaxID=221167 RepID=A0A9P7L1P3_9HYPO|nr:hypothetical protein H9Q70_005880 [Fusarium xylarioides]KAG5760789.1 hypothetical protein H9Q72_011087 [Fusarium xylarioides]KAG5787005.1 hypothetical protein H9Q69_013919 [Fusarium xylarioides]KAG5806098.1 hypothetical protein H9Q71_009323 [Fusarium xylarioides]KAG5823873.1 hypothetical protein H9Q74_006023 [Fusarium xylarioides]
MLPCTSAERGYVNIHYQQVIDLGSSVISSDITYASKSDANIPRNIRRLPVLSGRTLGLARCCCSVFVKKVDDVRLCLVLVDPPTNHVVGRRKYGLNTTYPATRLHGGIEDSIVSELHKDVLGQIDSSSLLSCLTHHFEVNPSQLNLNSPSILSLAYYPVRIILGEWNLYSHLISRYFKYYEYSMNDIAHRLHNDDIIDLQRWRRRSKQSQHKLIALAEFIDYWLDQEPDQKEWKLVIKDIRYMQRQLELYSQSFDQIVTVATSMIQILDSRRSIREAINAKRLTYIALVFVPLSWVASLFSMGGDFLPGKGLFWVYFVVGLPLVAVVLLISVYPFHDTTRFLN